MRKAGEQRVSTLLADSIGLGERIGVPLIAVMRSGFSPYADYCELARKLTEAREMLTSLLPKIDCDRVVAKCEVPIAKC
jgi:hypothetical protein